MANILWWIVVGLVVLLGFYCLYSYLEVRWVKAHPICDICLERVSGARITGFTLDHIDWDGVGRVPLDEAIARDMFKGYDDRNWEVYTVAVCDKCLIGMDDYQVSCSGRI